MKLNEHWRSFGPDHGIWDLVRYYRSLNAISRKQARHWLSHLQRTRAVAIDGEAEFPVPEGWPQHIADYAAACEQDAAYAFRQLRTEEEAVAFCESLGVTVKKTTTRSTDHHQASKAMVGGVTEVARRVCRDCGTTFNPDPQRRAVWCSQRGLHVSARNLDGAVPGLANPGIIWEIKEYWGKTKGGSKMSDAVYECHLVGRELRDFENKSGISVQHVVFVDGRDQWGYRRSDLVRFIDLFHQGLVDMLFIGREVESEWEGYLREMLAMRGCGT